MNKRLILHLLELIERRIASKPSEAEQKFITELVKFLAEEIKAQPDSSGWDFPVRRKRLRQAAEQRRRRHVLLGTEKQFWKELGHQPPAQPKRRRGRPPKAPQAQ